MPEYLLCAAFSRFVRLLDHGVARFYSTFTSVSPSAVGFFSVVGNVMIDVAVQEALTLSTGRPYNVVALSRRYEHRVLLQACRRKHRVTAVATNTRQ